MPSRKDVFESKLETRKKPSLADLMTPKGKNPAAKKRAVKRLVASAAKKPKFPNSTLVKSSGLLTKSKPSKKTTSAKPVAPTKRAASSTLKKPTVESSPKTDWQIRLPENMSIRAREKALVILQAVAEDFEKPVQKISYVAGFCLLVLGSYMSVAYTGLVPDIDRQLASTGSSSLYSTSTTLTSTGTTYPMAEFFILEPVPSPVVGEVTGMFKLTHAKDVRVKLTNTATAQTVILNTDSPTVDTYSFRVKQSDLAPTDAAQSVFMAEVQAYSQYTATSYRFPAGEFVVPTLVQPTSQNVSSSTTQTTTTNSTPTPTTTTSNPPLTSSTTPVFSDELDVKVKMRSNLVSGGAVVGAEVNKAVEKVIFTIRPQGITKHQFLGEDRKSSDGWQYYFDSKHFPDGEYFIFARAVLDATKNLGETSDPFKIKIDNYKDTQTTVVSPTMTTAPTPVEEEEEDETVVEDIPETTEITASPVRSFSEENFEIETTTETTSESVSSETDEILIEYRSELEDLLRRYAVAQQSGDALAIDIILKEIESARARIVTEALMDPEINHLANELDESFSERLETLKRHIDTFEELRRTAGTEDTRADKDGDGISDFDERNLYRTDPEKPDTDNDGFIDGVEIMKGFDPLNEIAEVPVNYELPQNTLALVQDEVLEVNTVSPVIVGDSNSSNVSVHAEVRGKGLPNSFVTLYIFSTPVIVTVRTDSDGSFVYNFEKELEDGEHEVYVAMTDNTGAIVARSNPFKFIKQAEAFTPADQIAGDMGNEMSLAEIKGLNMYNIVVGLGVLALGLILLMLGVSLREKDAMKMILPGNDIKTS